MTEKEGPVFVLMRFGGTVLRCKNALIKRSSVTANYGGTVMGLCDAKDICVTEGSDNWPANKHLCMLYFKEYKEAKRWEYGVPEIKQSDWMEGAEIIVVPACTHPDMNLSCFALLQLCVDEQMASQLADSMCQLLPRVQEAMKTCGTKNIVSRAQSERLRGAWVTNSMNIMQGASAEKMKEFYDSDAAKEMTALRHRIGQSTYIFFKLQPLTSKC